MINPLQFSKNKIWLSRVKIENDTAVVSVHLNLVLLLSSTLPLNIGKTVCLFWLAGLPDVLPESSLKWGAIF